jgi:Flp pilus assembly protein TadD
MYTDICLELSKQKQFSQAAKAYENAYGIAKSGALAIKLHTAYAQAGKPNEGDARLAQWLNESPNDNVARLYAADSDLKRGRYKEAIANYELLQQKQLDNVLLLNNLAWAYQQVKDRRALETAERAYKLKPDMAGVADTLGYILIEMGNTKRGLELLQQAAAKAPRDSTIRYHLAQGWFKAGDKAKARDELTRLLSTDAKFPERAEAVKLLRQLNN